MSRAPEAGAAAAGLTLVETLVAMMILGIALVGVLGAFSVQLGTNTRCALRSGAVTAARQTMEELRLQDPSDLPESGASAPQLVTVDGEAYEVTTRYCVRSDLCNDSSRHLVVEVSHDGRRIFRVETVYTQLL